MTTRAELKEILADVLDIDTDDISIVSANDDGDVKITFSELFLDDTDDVEEDEDEEDDEEVKEDAEVEDDANTVHDTEEETKAE